MVPMPGTGDASELGQRSQPKEALSMMVSSDGAAWLQGWQSQSAGSRWSASWNSI